MIDFAEKLLKGIREDKQTREAYLINGNIDSMEKYKSTVGELTGLSLAEEKIISLLDEMERKDG
jgi:hypothetical protein